MKNINQFITEKFKVSSKNISKYDYFPTDKDLSKLIRKLIKERGLNCDLNDIDTSKITDMSQLFEFSHFNGDISKWNVSNVKDMENMFHGSKFNGDISNWDISNVENMDGMFAMSEFNCSNGDISDWKVNATTYNMFLGTPKQQWKNKPNWAE